MKIISRYWIIALVTVLPGLIAYIYFSQRETPAEEVARARELISLMKSGNWDEYSPNTAARSQAAYDSAMQYWQSENRRLFFLRNFEQSIEWAGLSYDLAKEAIRAGQEREKQLTAQIPSRIDEVRKMADEYDRLFKQFPLSQKLQHNLAKSHMLIGESQQLLTKQKYTESLEKADEAAALLEKVMNHASTRMQDYFSAYPSWKAWVQQGIARSAAQKSILVVVDKYDRSCLVYQSGKLLQSYRIELGPNWIGDKLYQGDQSTPEGLYFITQKKSTGQTRYHKALLLNYPNPEDQERFQENKRKGRISRHARIGNLIEIHGHGGQGVDWTNGCVALSDADMDNLFHLARVSTPVIIVGSGRSWSEIVQTKK